MRPVDDPDRTRSRWTGRRSEVEGERSTTEVVEPIQGPVLDAAARRRRRSRRRGSPATRSCSPTVTWSASPSPGEGVPLVVVHGFSAEGFLYAQSLSRLVKMGFRVIAIDTAGHGATQGLPLSGQNLNDYADLLGRVIDELGHRAVHRRRALDGRPAHHPDGGRAARA